MRFRAKRDEERERGVQIVGTGACFKKRTRGKRGEISSRFFSSSFSRPRSQAPGSVLSWILLRHPARSRLTWRSTAFFCLFSLFFCFILFYFFFLLLVIVTFLRFVVSSLPIRITLECKQIIPFSPHPSPLSTLSFFHPGNFSRDTSCDSVWPMKSSLHVSYQGSRGRSVAGKRNFQTSSRFHQSCSHGLIQSSHQAFPYA